MKSLLLLLVLAVPANAQVNEPNGYGKLLQAGKLILPGPSGGPEAPKGIKPAENLRRERLAVARNAPALQQLREALQMGIAMPTEETDWGLSSPYSKTRTLARQLVQEADVCAADGDYLGAVNSRLDCMELGAQVSRGTSLWSLVGSAIEAIGASPGLEVFASHLDANQCRQAAERLHKIDGTRASYADFLRLDEAQSLRDHLKLLGYYRPNTWLTHAQLMSDPDSKEWAAKAANLNSDQLKGNNKKLFAAAIQNAALPFQQAKITQFPTDLDELTKGSLQFIQNPRQRLLNERDIMRSRLLQSAFELRAIKLETGQHPEQFEAPIDTFSPDLKPLIYKRSGEGYSLYSVGPDGKDDGGKPLSSAYSYFDPTTGTTVQIRRFQADTDSKGDLVAPKF